MKQNRKLMTHAAISAAIFLLVFSALQVQPTRAVLLVTEDAHLGIVCTSCSSISTSFTVGNHPNETLIIYTFIEPNFAITGVSYNGIAALAINGGINAGGSSTVPFSFEVDRIIAPTQGSHTLTVSFGGSAPVAEVYVVDFYNTEPSNPIDGTAIQSCYWAQCSNAVRTLNINTRNQNEYVSSWIAVGSLNANLGLGEITARGSLTNVASTGAGAIPNSAIESLDTLNPQPTAPNGYSATYTLSVANDADTLIGVALNPTGQGIGGTQCAQQNNCVTTGSSANAGNLAAIINFMVPFFIIATPAVMFWKETKSIFLLLVGMILGAAIAASAGLVAAWVPFVIVTALVMWMVRGGR